MPTTDDFCRAQASDEPLRGTARPDVHRWVLVEDGEAWGAKVPRDTHLPAEVIARLIEIDAEPHTRVQLIRRPGQGCGPRRRVFVVDSPVEPRGRRIATRELELDALASFDPEATLTRLGRAEPGLDALWLVCTHGTRDRCCAKWGMALWDRLVALAPERAWQVSHLGGHRFAPTFMALPVGLNWGRFDPDALAPLLDALDRGELGSLDHLRGRTAYPAAAQVAEVELRQRHGWQGDADLVLRGSRLTEDGGFVVAFDTPTGPRTVDVESRDAPPTPSNCGDEPSPRVALHVVG